MNMDTRGLRLKNCLQTILELEESLDNTPLGSALQQEFVVLREVMQRLESTVVEESDVCRIEAATTRFLEEIKGTLNDDPVTAVVSTRLLQ